jgi:hypothetical protein
MSDTRAQNDRDGVLIIATTTLESALRALSLPPSRREHGSSIRKAS